MPRTVRSVQGGEVYHVRYGSPQNLKLLRLGQIDTSGLPPGTIHKGRISETDQRTTFLRLLLRASDRLPAPRTREDEALGRLHHY